MKTKKKLKKLKIYILYKLNKIKINIYNICRKSKKILKGNFLII